MPQFDQTQYPVGMDVDANGYPIPKVSAQLTGSNVIQPTDIQSHLQTTIQTHNAVSVALSGNSVGSWIDADGFDKIGCTMAGDNSFSNSCSIHWSNDGSTLHGAESIIATGTGQQRAGITDTKSRYFRLVLGNNDSAAAHTMSAWAFLKA